MQKNKSQIHILHILPTLDTGGAERLLIDIAKGLNANRFKQAVLCFKWGGELVEEMRKTGTQVFVLEKKLAFDPLNFIKIWKIISKLKPDIIHTHLGADMYGRLIAGLKGIPVVSTEHNLNKDEGSMTRFLKKATIHYAKALIAVSQAVARDAHERYSVPLEKYEIIHNGVDTSRFSPSPHIFNKVLRIGSVGRLSEQKGFDVLIEAIHLLDDKDIVCEIAGEGSLRSQLESQIKKNNLSNQIKLIGVRHDIPEFLASLDIFVLPSRWEGLGIAALEAALVQIPIIVSNVDGLQEIVDDAHNGLVFDSGDAHDLAQKISWYKEHETEAHQFAKQLREKVAANFDIAKMLEKYEAVYEKVLRD